MFPSVKPQGRRDNPHKVYVKVRCDCDFDGQIRPIMLRTEESRPLKIDRITDVRMAASTKAGGCGIRYTCMIDGHELYLFHDRDWWFVEKDGLDQMIGEGQC